MELVLRSREVALIDDEDCAKVAGLPWITDAQGYVHAWVGDERLLLHRVCWTRYGWQARIAVSRTKRLFLGYFTSEINAAKTYNDAATRHFGEFALLNEV